MNLHKCSEFKHELQIIKLLLREYIVSRNIYKRGFHLFAEKNFKFEDYIKVHFSEKILKGLKDSGSRVNDGVLIDYIEATLELHKFQLHEPK
jgi:hypothetical protein